MSPARFYAAGFGALLLLDTWTQVALKLATRRTGEFSWTAAWLEAAALTPWIYGAMAGYLGAFLTWMTLLKRAPVGPAFAASHLEVVTVSIVSVPLFGERLARAQIAGAVCIVAGIVLLSLGGSKREDA